VVNVPKLLYLSYEDVELLVVGIFLKSGPTLQAVYDQFHADLCIFHAHPHIGLEELAEGLFPKCFSLLIQLHNILIDLRMIFIEKVSVGGIEEPILSLI
jgi:orotate phosphoribosyltransferase-like protein